MRVGTPAAFISLFMSAIVQSPKWIIPATIAASAFASRNPRIVI